MSNLPLYIAAGAAAVTAGVFAIQSMRVEAAVRRLNRSRDFYENTARELAVMDAQDKLPASRTYIMCAGCGASVEVEDDGFTPRWHKCFVPDAATVTPEGDNLTPFIGDTIAPRYEGKKIPIGLKGHLHKL